MRAKFRDIVTELARRDPRVILIIGDIGGGLFLPFRKEMPKQFFNIGICEQSMIGFAAGLAISGLRPIVFTITPFLLERAYEQIKVDIHLQCAPVGLVGYSDTTEGPTHHPLDAKKLMVLCPNIQSLFPATAAEIPSLFANLDLNRPWFLNLTKETA
jgi:transketolase